MEKDERYQNTIIVAKLYYINRIGRLFYHRVTTIEIGRDKSRYFLFLKLSIFYLEISRFFESHCEKNFTFYFSTKFYYNYY